ncbi:hypothetical protein AB0K68_31930 [Streptomyces sp. NPDC050698]
MNNRRTKAPGDAGDAGDAEERGTRAGAARGPWAVLSAAVTVVLGPAAVTAFALGQANAAPMHHTARTGRTPTYPASGPSRPRTL